MSKRIIIIEEDDGNNKLPYIGVSPSDGLYQHYDPCANCINNPLINPNASGTCCCALPDLYNKRYYNSMAGGGLTYTTSYTANTI